LEIPFSENLKTPIEERKKERKKERRKTKGRKREVTNVSFGCERLHR